MNNRRLVVKVDLPNFIIFLICAANFALIVFSTQNYMNYTFFSLAARILIILNLALFFVTIFSKKGIRIATRNEIIIVGMMTVASVFSYIFSGGPSTYDFVIAVLGYLAIPLYILVSQEINTFEDTKNIIMIFSIITALFFIYLGFFHPVYRAKTKVLSFGYSNPNRAGTYLMLNGLLLISSAERVKTFYRKLLLWVLTGVLLYLIVLTQCRTTFIILASVLVYVVVPSAPKVGKKFLTVCTLMPFAFSWIYVILYNQGWMQTLEIFGKPIYSGRQALFQSEFLGFSLFGHYNISGIGGLNLGIGLLNGFGIIGTLLFCIFIFHFNRYHVLISDIKNEQKTFSVFCFGMVMLHACTEVSLFTGGSVYAGLMGLILIQMQIKIRDEKCSITKTDDCRRDYNNG